ncbi:hypothetical protein MXB_682, partial [Myxobolus squamalis]
YCELLNLIIVLLEYNWLPSICIVDFDKGLVDEVKCQFTETVILCFFFVLNMHCLKKRKNLIS